MQAKFMKLAKGSESGSACASQPPRVGGSPHISVARSQGASVAAKSSRTGQKRRAEEASARDTGKRRAEGEPRRDTGKRAMSSAVPQAGKRSSVDPVTGPLEPWVDSERALSGYQEAARRVLKVEVGESMFPEEIG